MRSWISSRLRRWLAHPRLPAHLALLAVLLTLPALWVGLQFDDYFHRLIMLGAPGLESQPMQVFSTLRGDPQVLGRYIDLGLFPWWTPAGYRFAFFRYLSAASMWLDYQLWPDSPALMHAHSLACYAALVAAAALLYRRLMGAGWAAGLAALLYAVDEAHAGAVAWIANRNALLATLFGILALLAHDRWRRDGSRRAAVLAPVLLGLALCSGEMALAAAGYLAAYAIFLDRGTRRDRLRALAPHAGVLLAWAVLYKTLGFGTHGSGFYLDPLERPLAYARAFAERAPLLLLGQWSPIPADWGTFLPPEWFVALWIAGVALAVLAAIFLVPLLRRDRAARFWAAGMALSLLPIVAVAPANRLLFFVGLGGMALLALFARGVVEGDAWVPGHRAWCVSARIALGALAIFHLGLAPLASPLVAYSMKPAGEAMVQSVASVPDDATITGQDLVLVNPPDYLFSVSPIGTLKILEGKPYPRRLRALVSGNSPVEISRVDERTLRVVTEESIYGGALGRLFRSRYYPMHPGERFDLTGMTVEIVRTDPEGAPLEFLHTFAVPLEDGSLRWLCWQEGRYVPFRPPAIGRSVRLPPAYGPLDAFRRPRPTG